MYKNDNNSILLSQVRLWGKKDCVEFLVKRKEVRIVANNNLRSFNVEVVEDVLNQMDIDLLKSKIVEIIQVSNEKDKPYSEEFFL